MPKSLIEMFFLSTATIRNFKHYGAGESVFLDAETRKCRVELAKNVKTLYKNISGQLEETPAKAIMFCKGNPIPPGSEVEVKGKTYVVLNCVEMNGFGSHHLEVYLA